MKKEEIIKQVFHKPQVAPPPISYKITDVMDGGKEEYTSEYIDVGDFKRYLKDLEQQLIRRLK